MVHSNHTDDDLTTNRGNVPRWWTRQLSVVESTFDELVSERLAEHAQFIFRAKELARHIHEGQTRIGGGSYLIHPLRVAISLMEELAISDPLIITAAVLHDSIEDSDQSEERIAGQVGSFVARLVASVSRRMNENRPNAADSFESPYFKRVREAEDLAIVLRTADKVDNLRDALYHPSRTKRRVLVQEVDRVFLPLIESVKDREVRERLNNMLQEAAASHDMRSLLGIIDEQVGRTQKGEPLFLPPACRDDALLLYVLFNPTLSCWISDDGIQLTKSVLSSRDIAANVARKYAQFIETGRVNCLLEFTPIPAQLASARNARHWRRTALQLEELCRLLIQEPVHEWCKPILEASSAPWLLLVIHSLLYRPANWIFPIWHSEYGEALAGSGNRSPYAHRQPESETKAFHRFLRFLLISRQALERYCDGLGTLQRAESIFAAAPAGIPLRIAWSARFLSEYLDAVTDSEGGTATSRQFEKLSMLWDMLSRREFNSEALTEIPTAALLRGRNAVSPSLAGAKIEIIGLDEVQKIFDESTRSEEFRILLNLLASFCDRNAGGTNPWISFETSEFVKRRELFADNRGLRLNERTSFEDLEACGIRTRFQAIDGSGVLKVFPARRFALQNRLPEISEADLEAISANGYSAEAIFDRLILEPIKGGEPVWVPRVYRILDTIEDLDPENVQAIDITFSGPADEAEFRTFLPLPSPDNAIETDQEMRKETVARYIVTQIYNHGITRCLLTANIECAVLDEVRAGHGFTNDRLMEMILDAEQALGLRGSYGRFIEGFNFSPFQFLSGSSAEDPLAFEESDMRSGLFLGIDIGGSDIKFALFDKGRDLALKSRDSLGKIPTFANKEVTEVDAAAFCGRVVRTISEWFEDPGRFWSLISGIGISWPGAVRGNRVAGISGTLEKLMYQGATFSPSSPPTEIHSFPLLDLFQKSLQEFASRHKFQLDPSLTLVLENDGNSEAFGNYCSRVLKKRNKPGGKLIVKLGTSLAGGRVRQDSAIANDVAEFSKIVLNLNSPSPNKPPGTARDYVSSLGVRNLSRTFQFRGKPLFGERAGENTEKETGTRIEAVELGGLLDLWRAGVSDRARKIYLEELVKTDNKPQSSEFEESLAVLEVFLKPGGNLTQDLVDYAAARDREWAARQRSKKKDESAAAPLTETGECREGWARVNWLCTGTHPNPSGAFDSETRISLPEGVLAEKVLGTVALFSQLSLQIAHLVAALYNIYRRDCFNEVILAGGVLSGLTGAIVKTQTEAFLLKYYDKIYGDGKSLPLDAIQLAESDNRELMGPLGAAMLANRAHKSERLKAMRRLVDFLIRGCPAGNALRMADLVNVLRERGINSTEREVRDYLYTKVADSILIPDHDERVFIKAVEASS